MLDRNVERFRGGLVFKAHRLLYHSTLGSRVIKKKKKIHKPDSGEHQHKGLVFGVRAGPQCREREVGAISKGGRASRALVRRLGIRDWGVGFMV